MLELFIIFGSPVLFWIAISAFIVLELVFVSKEFCGRATLILAILLGLLFFSPINPLGYLWKHPLETPLWIGVYLSIGAIWSIIRWYLFVKKRRWAYDERKRAFLRESIPNPTAEEIANGFTPEGMVIPDALKGRWRTIILDNRQYEDRKISKPLAKENKGKITTWITYWPFSIFWYVLGDLLIDIGNAIYRKLAKLYQSISDHSYGDTDKDTHI